jgi:type II secretory pathway component PulF
MQGFIYKAKKGPHEIKEGVIEAETKQDAISRIEQMGYVPVQITPKEGMSKPSCPDPKKNKIKAPIANFKVFKKVRPRDLTIFTEQLATLIKSKVPLFDAINILSEQTENVFFKNIICSISGDLKEGRTFSESLSKYPAVFPLLYINMVCSGESGGVLEKTLIRLAQFREEEEEIRAKISSALAYPIFIIIVGAATISALLTFGVPRLMFLFSETGQSLPVPTQMLLSISEGIRGYWFWILLIISLFVFILKRGHKNEKGKIILNKFKLKVPLLGNFSKNAELARLARTISTLLANGIPAFQAIQITIPTLNNEIFKVELDNIHKDIIAGSSISQSMKKSPWFPLFVTNMIAVAEKTGNLQEVLLEVAVFYEREVNKMMKIMTSLLEPIIILVMGLIVGFIVMAMLLPIFEINMGI